MNFELGKVNILFGTVTSVDDSLKKYRVQVSINGYTDMIDESDIPWYFPWYGVNYLPQVDDIVPVIIFDNKIWNGFYGNVIDRSSSYSGIDYEHYLEIFKRQVGNNQVSLTYKPSSGIEFLNAESGISVETEKVILFSSMNSIEISDSSINLGTDATKMVPYGDDIVEVLLQICDCMLSMISQFTSETGAWGIMKTSAVNPYTANLIPAMVQMKANMTTVYQALSNIKLGIDKNLLCSHTVKVK